MTLKEIAAMTGTSVSTVSRVLNQTSPTCASKETQDKIWAAVRKTGYQPNRAAQALRREGAASTAENRGPVQEAVFVTVVLARIASLDDEPFFAELFRCLEIELMRNGGVIREVIHAKEALPQSVPADGGIVIFGRCSEMLLKSILARNPNVVGIWRNPVDFNVDEVVCDGQKAAEAAIAHLLSLGHRKIAYIGSCSYESRYVGYCDMLIRNSIPIDYALIKPTDQSRAEAEGALMELLRQRAEGSADFSAIFCANDNTAVRVLELLEEHRRDVRPGRISVISIDDIDAAQNTRPFLTTVRIPRDEMAHMAVVLLLDRIAGGHREIVRVEFPCRIVRRTSCFPAAQN